MQRCRQRQPARIVHPSQAFEPAFGWSALSGLLRSTYRTLRPAWRALFREGKILDFPPRCSCWPMPSRTGCTARPQFNLYYSPAALPCFDPHYDTQELFVFQIEGRKRWDVWHDAEPPPLHRAKHGCGSRPGGAPDWTPGGGDDALEGLLEELAAGNVAEWRQRFEQHLHERREARSAALDLPLLPEAGAPRT